MAKSCSLFFVDPLYSRMADDLHLGGMSQRTHDGYLRAVRQLADYCKTAPDQVSEDQLRRYFLHLKNEKKFAYGSLRVAFSGIKFFYTRTCRRDWQTLATMKLQNVKSLPEVLTIPQVHRIIDAATKMRMAVYFWTVYSMGLRMQEGLNLQAGDIDADRGMVHIHRGKGARNLENAHRRRHGIRPRLRPAHVATWVSKDPPLRLDEFQLKSHPGRSQMADLVVPRLDVLAG